MKAGCTMEYYLGFDSSTQGLKALVIDAAKGAIVAHASVNFSLDLPQFNCDNGVLPHPDPLVKHADPLLWLAALDLSLARLVAQGVALRSVVAIGGAAQQHGSVYLNHHFPAVLAQLHSATDAGELATRLAPALARPTSPIWMDSSTTPECQELVARFGAELCQVTGSPATERFTGAQIRKFAREEPARYAATTHIHLVSSFLCSILCGAPAPIDIGDAAGMNLLDLHALAWAPDIVAFTAPELEARLPRIAPPSQPQAGGLANYFARYGLRPGIPVAVWTGDNPASLVGSGAWTPGLAVVSLGTSDTFFAAMPTYRLDPEGYGHVFGHPLGGYMSLTCFKNGSLARDRVRRSGGMDWEFFDRKAMELTPPGNAGSLALPWFESEITPLVLEPGLRANFDFTAAAPEVQARAVLEAQVLAMRTHAAWIGDFAVLRVTGGAARSDGLRQILADVFQARVETIAVADSAALGGAMLGARCVQADLDTLREALTPVTATCHPRTEYAQLYTQLMPTLRDLAQMAPISCR